MLVDMGALELAFTGRPQSDLPFSNLGLTKSRTKQNPEVPLTPPEGTTPHRHPRPCNPGTDALLPPSGRTSAGSGFRNSVLLWADLSALKSPFTKHAAPRAYDTTSFHSFAGRKTFPQPQNVHAKRLAPQRAAALKGALPEGLLGGQRKGEALFFTFQWGPPLSPGEHPPCLQKEVQRWGSRRSPGNVQAWSGTAGEGRVGL